VAKLDIVIVNWNSGEHLRRCLESISGASSGVDLRRVVVVDNASTDGSCTDLEAGSLPLESLRNESNLGFGRACNQGVGGDVADYVLFLNPDAALSSDSLVTALNYLAEDRQSRIGVLGLQLTGEDGRVLPTCSRFPTPARLFWQATGLALLYPGILRGMRMVEWDHAETRRVDQVMGACFFVRGEVFRRLAGFDERFFLYFEEVDFCLRATRAGFEVVYLVDAQVVHEGGGSSGSVPAERLLYSWRSRIQFARKHLGAVGTLVVVASTLCCESPLRVIQQTSKLSWTGVRGVLWASRRLVAGLPGLLRGGDGT
jgi:N-acetylglucosaminyl-diphospho-decaprenol L-rhamnosyltransferase